MKRFAFVSVFHQSHLSADSNVIQLTGTWIQPAVRLSVRNRWLNDLFVCFVIVAGDFAFRFFFSQFENKRKTATETWPRPDYCPVITATGRCPFGNCANRKRNLLCFWWFLRFVLSVSARFSTCPTLGALADAFTIKSNKWGLNCWYHRHHSWRTLERPCPSFDMKEKPKMILMLLEIEKSSRFQYILFTPTFNYLFPVNHCLLS